MKFLSLFLILSIIFLFSCSEEDSGCVVHSDCSKTGYCNPKNSICEESPCLEHTECNTNGICVITTDGLPECLCNKGFKTDENSLFICVTKCYGETCSNHGECKTDSETGRAYCNCDQGYEEGSKLSCLEAP